jgi:hypothetical protein
MSSYCYKHSYIIVTGYVNTSRWAKERDPSGDGGCSQLAVKAGEWKAATNGQFRLGGIVGGELIASGQRYGVTKGSCALSHS